MPQDDPRPTWADYQTIKRMVENQYDALRRLERDIEDRRHRLHVLDIDVMQRESDLADLEADLEERRRERDHLRRPKVTPVAGRGAAARKAFREKDREEGPERPDERTH